MKLTIVLTVWFRVVCRRVILPQSILAKAGPQVVHLQRRFHPGPPGPLPMLRLMAINRPPAPLRGEGACLIGIQVSIPLCGLLVPGH